jgi:hypothetical protein
MESAEHTPSFDVHLASIYVLVRSFLFFPLNKDLIVKLILYIWPLAHYNTFSWTSLTHNMYQNKCIYRSLENYLDNTKKLPNLDQFFFLKKRQKERGTQPKTGQARPQKTKTQHNRLLSPTALNA